MFSQINNNREMQNDVQNLNIKLEKVEKKLDEVVNSVQDMSNQLKYISLVEEVQVKFKSAKTTYQRLKKKYDEGIAAVTTSGVGAAHRVR